MGHSGLRTSKNEWKFTAQVIIQHQGTAQPYTAISWLARAPSRTKNIRMAHHCALKKQPTKVDHFTLVDCDRET